MGHFGLKPYKYIVHIKQCLTDKAIVTRGKNIVTYICMLQYYVPIQYSQHCIIFILSLSEKTVKPCLV